MVIHVLIRISRNRLGFAKAIEHPELSIGKTLGNQHREGNPRPPGDQVDCLHWSFVAGRLSPARLRGWSFHHGQPCLPWAKSKRARSKGQPVLPGGGGGSSFRVGQCIITDPKCFSQSADRQLVINDFTLRQMRLAANRQTSASKRLISLYSYPVGNISQYVCQGTLR